MRRVERGRQLEGHGWCRQRPAAHTAARTGTKNKSSPSNRRSMIESRSISVFPSAMLSDLPYAGGISAEGLERVVLSTGRPVTSEKAKAGRFPPFEVRCSSQAKKGLLANDVFQVPLPTLLMAAAGWPVVKSCRRPRTGQRCCSVGCTRDAPTRAASFPSSDARPCIPSWRRPRQRHRAVAHVQAVAHFR